MTVAYCKRASMRRGLMCYLSGGTVDGTRGDHILLAPPYIIEPHEIDMIVERLAGAIAAACAA